MFAFATSHAPTTIFPPWHFDTWKAVDDRIRGGGSKSHLDPVEVDGSHVASEELIADEKMTTAARFWGTLDIKTLGGAGFASQRHIFGPRPLSLPRNKYKGICLSLLPDQFEGGKSSRGTSSSSPPASSSVLSSSKPTEFTLVLKMTIRHRTPSPPRVPPSPEPASLSHEATFSSPPPPSCTSSSPACPSHKTRVCISWSDFTATYRGRPVPRSDPRYAPLDPSKIYELSLMCRSRFGKQEGEFGVVVLGIEGWVLGEGEGSVREGCWGGLGRWNVGLFGRDGGEGKIRLGEDEKAT